MITVIVRLVLLAVSWTGAITTSAVFAQQPPVSIDGSQVNFGLFVFVSCVIGAIGFTWALAAQWNKLRSEVRDHKRDIRMLKQRLGVHAEEEDQEEGG